MELILSYTTEDCYTTEDYRNAAKLARTGLAAMRHRGWAQGISMTRDGRVCLTGAICLPLGGSVSIYQRHPIMALLADVMQHHVEELYPGYTFFRSNIRFAQLIAWNDAEGRTQGEVEALFEKTIATLEEHA
jgi:hypothetical protein